MSGVQDFGHGVPHCCGIHFTALTNRFLATLHWGSANSQVWEEDSMRKILALGVLAAAAAVAQAAVVDIPIAGWQTFGAYLAPGNTFTNIALPVGSTIDAAEFIDVTFTALGFSYGSEFTLSLNDSTTGGFWDSGVVDPNAPGVYGPVSGAFDNPGVFGSGPFTLTTGDLFVTVYETFNDGGNAVQDAQVSSGLIRVHYTVPEPTSIALIGLGALALIRRR